jgi:hypothetical protein
VITLLGNLGGQREGEVTIGCVGIVHVNDVYAAVAQNSCPCTKQLHGLFQKIHTDVSLK